ncbi:MAG: glycoside hydrolase family 2 protein [Desertimonas sp.]
MELVGPWKAHIADDDLRRRGIGLDTPDEGWVDLAVPGHWRHHPDFAATDGPVLYRRRFTMTPPEPGRRRWVTFNGIFYQADVWLDGAYLGDPEGYFFPHSFDITSLSRLGEDHVLAVELSCRPEPSSGHRRNITGLFQQSEAMDQDWNPGGIWAPVIVYDTGPVRIDRLRVLCRDADDTRAHVRVAARLDSDDTNTVRLRTTADGTVLAETEHTLAAGANEIEWAIDIDRPRLWWPRALGDQPLTTIEVEVLMDGEVIDRRRRQTGLREVAVNDWILSVNGERLFLKGANIVPTRPGLADVDEATVRADIDRAVTAELDALRVQAHIAHPALYRAADERGIVLLQDFPLLRGYQRSVRREAVRQAREAVDALGHHPSIVQWSAHDEPDASAPGDGDGRRLSRLGRAAARQLPSWNRSVLDRWIKRALEQSDPTRPVVAHGGVAPNLPRLDGTDRHLWLGWRRGEIGDLADRARLVPRSVRFVSEFGSQSVPDTSADMIEPARWPDLDWERLARHHGADVVRLLARFPPEQSPTFAAWRLATQRYQARLLREQIETLRRLKYRPSGGFTFSWLRDPAPMISAAVVDHAGQPKLAWQEVIEACRPVTLIPDPLPDEVLAGRRLRLEVHVVNDRRAAIDDAAVSVTCTWRSGRRDWAFRGAVEADSVERVAVLELTAPDAPGELLFGYALAGRDEHGVPVAVRRRSGCRIVAT